MMFKQLQTRQHWQHSDPQKDQAPAVVTVQIVKFIARCLFALINSLAQPFFKLVLKGKDLVQLPFQ